jgi:hypothetical protein
VPLASADAPTLEKHLRRLANKGLGTSPVAAVDLPSLFASVFFGVEAPSAPASRR